MDTDSNDGSSWYGYDARVAFYITWDLAGFSHPEAIVAYNIATKLNEGKAFDAATRILCEYGGESGKIMRYYGCQWICLV